MPQRAAICEEVEEVDGSDHELSVKHPDGSLVLADDVQLLVRDVFGSLVVLLGTLAACPAGVALIVRHYRHRVRSMH